MWRDREKGKRGGEGRGRLVIGGNFGGLQIEQLAQEN